MEDAPQQKARAARLVHIHALVPRVLGQLPIPVPAPPPPHALAAVLVVHRARHASASRRELGRAAERGHPAPRVARGVRRRPHGDGRARREQRLQRGVQARREAREARGGACEEYVLWG